MEFESLKIRKKGSPNHLLLTPDGIWSCGPGHAVFASIQIDNGRPVVVVADHRQNYGGHQIAMSVDDNGDPVVQFVNAEGKVLQLRYNDLMNIAHTNGHSMGNTLRGDAPIV